MGGGHPATKTRGGYTETINYDGFGRPRIFNRGGIVSTVEYDVYGRVRLESLPGAATGTSYEYDLLGRLKKITNADASFKTLSYSGNQVTLVDERSQSFVGRFRSWGDPNHRELVSLTTPVAAANLTFVRNGRGQITSVTQNGKTRTLTYNPTTFFLENETHPEQGTIVYGRDAIGNMKNRRVGSSPTTQFDYDDITACALSRCRPGPCDHVHARRKWQYQNRQPRQRPTQLPLRRKRQSAHRAS